MGQIAFINREAAAQKAASETITFFRSLRTQLENFHQSSLAYDEYTQDFRDCEYLLQRGLNVMANATDSILANLKNQANSYAAELCQSPDVDLVLDSSVVMAGDSANNMTEQCANYLIENSSELLSIKDK